LWYRFYPLLRCRLTSVHNIAGKWPLWLSPRQAIVVPIMPMFDEYAVEVRNKLYKAGFVVDTDLSTRKLNKKV
jgi:threonyl-tRNA synthetase